MKITIDEDSYYRLMACRRPKETVSDTINRLAKNYEK